MSFEVLIVVADSLLLLANAHSYFSFYFWFRRDSVADVSIPSFLKIFTSWYVRLHYLTLSTHLHTISTFDWIPWMRFHLSRLKFSRNTFASPFMPTSVNTLWQTPCLLSKIFASKIHPYNSNITIYTSFGQSQN